MLLSGTVMAQDVARSGASGIVVDAETGETLPFAQIYFIDPNSSKIQTSIGTTSDMDGFFSLTNTQGYTTMHITMIGYKTEMLTVRSGQIRNNVKVKMRPDVYGLQDIVVTPKHQKRNYKRRGNPAVELIKNVIARKDSGTIRTEPYYTADSYARMSFALDNFHPDFQKPFWRKFAFAEKYIDTTGVYPSMTISIREHLNKEYYQQRPHRERKVLETKRVFGIEDIIGSETFQANIDLIFRDADINDDNMALLNNRFVSPLNSTIATTYYQYYIMDTLLVEGYPCIDLAFVPVNSESYGFTGHLYIVNDSTYKIKKYAINVPPDINLNFVSNFSIEHSNVQLPNGDWVPDRTQTYAKFYMFSKKSGILARQTKIYTAWDTETEIEPVKFNAYANFAAEDSAANRYGAAAWDTLRPEPLTRYETSVYDLVEEFEANPVFNSLTMLINAITTEYVTTVGGDHMWDSKWDFGPIYNTISWNTLEGVRLRIGGTSTVNLHPHLFVQGYAAYGFGDNRPKYNATLIYAFGKHKYHPYDEIRHHLKLTAQYDVEEPGQITDVIRRDNILMSIPTGKPTLGNTMYVFHTKLDYMKEWRNGICLKAGFDYSNTEASGALTFDRIRRFGDVSTTQRVKRYNCYEGTLEFRYNPGGRLYIDCTGNESPFALDKDAPVFKVNHTIGYLDDRPTGGDGFLYNRTEITVDKRFWLSAFGCLDLRVQTGMVWQKVPFTKLFIPQSSTSIFLAQRAFNQMQPMEFLMDEYVALFMTYYAKGWLLNRIPGINRLKLRGVLSFSGIYGGLTDKNNPYIEAGSGLYQFPNNARYNENNEWESGYCSSPIGKLPYMELTAGLENIFRFIRIDYVRRLTYNEYTLPDGIHTKKMGAWGRNGVKITARFSL